MKASLLLSFTKHYKSHKMKENEIVGACLVWRRRKIQTGLRR
jgi:hypothetical protein